MNGAGTGHRRSVRSSEHRPPRARTCAGGSPTGRRLGRELLQGLGGSDAAEPSALDLMPRAPISFIASCLACMPAVSAHAGACRCTTSRTGDGDGAPPTAHPDTACEAHDRGVIDAALLRVKPEVRPMVSAWIGGMLRHAGSTMLRPYLYGLDTLTPVLTMPEAAVLPTLSGASGRGEGSRLPSARRVRRRMRRGLVDTFRLGGTFVDYARFLVIQVAPDGRLERGGGFASRPGGRHRRCCGVGSLTLSSRSAAPWASKVLMFAARPADCA